MAWFDDPDEYYGPGDENTAIAQGDIVITPTATLFLGEGEPDAVAPELGEHRTVRLWRGADHDRVVAAPTLSAEVGWALAMVIPHNCAMEKDWNERVAELVASGASQGEAEQQAGSDTGLDPLHGYSDSSRCRTVGEARTLDSIGLASERLPGCRQRPGP